MLIRKSNDADLPEVLGIINAAAEAYRGVIPPDRWHEPYMSDEELTREIAHGVVFWVAEEKGDVRGVMGIQDKGAVALVRHAYVAPGTQRSGVGTMLLRHIESATPKPILIGTWADASWAIDFYRRNGFTVVPDADKERLLRTYWSIPDRQIQTSVVLADRRWVHTSTDAKEFASRSAQVQHIKGLVAQLARLAPASSEAEALLGQIDHWLNDLEWHLGGS